MGMAIGARSLLDNALPTGVDASVLFQRGLEEGIGTSEVLMLAATIIGETNERLEAKYGGLLYFTERDFARYRQGEGARHVTHESAEFSRVDGRRARKIGHMLPRNDFEDVTEFTRQYLRRGNEEDVRNDIEIVAEGWENRVDLDVWTRALTTTEVLVGTSGYSPGWAIGSGGNVPYIPPPKGSIVFDSTHTQYLRNNNALSAAQAATTLGNAARLLSRLGHSGRKVAFISESDVSTYTAIGKKFVQFVPGQFVVVAGATDQTITQGELEGVPGEVFGYFLSDYGVVELRYQETIPTGYGFMTKSYGMNHPRNPLAARIEPGLGFGLTVDPEIRFGNMPRLEHIDYYATHGIGVNDRLNGVAFQIESGGATYDNPTIS